MRRTGRHTKPSQVQNAADKAYKAAPAMAMAGVLITSSPAHAVAGGPVRATTVAEQLYTAPVPAGAAERVYTDALVVHHEEPRRYQVRPGDTLSSIAQRYYGSTADWRLLYQANRAVIADPNEIFPGEVLDIPDGPSASTTAAPAATVLTTASTLSGTLSCAGLEELWEQAGGSAAEAVMAASIAMAESSGEQYATGTVGERGYWQINPDHGSLSTYNPLGNAKAAVIISDDGTNWTPWTTFTSGVYRGRC